MVRERTDDTTRGCASVRVTAISPAGRILAAPIAQTSSSGAEMSPFDPAGRRDARARAGTRRAGKSAGHAAEAARRFSLYVEGPRDGDILRVWARRVCPAMVRPLEHCMVILGGRRPARALEHFRAAGGGATGRRGLVVLDRDHHASESALDAAALHAEPGLELFTWGRRHIESYLLVRDAIGRVVSDRSDRESIDRLIEHHVPPASDEAACSGLDAKRLLGTKGALARALGHVVSPAAVARSMRSEELHADVIGLLERIRGALGLGAEGLQVVKRSPRGGG